MNTRKTISLETEYMTESQLAYFKRRLLDETDIIRSIVDELIEQIKATDDVMDEADAAEHSLETSEGLFRINQLETELSQMQIALDLINDGSFGYCVDCGDEIGIARLTSQPAAIRDIDCQTRFEKKSAISNARKF